MTPDGKPWPAPDPQDFVQVLSDHAKVLVPIDDCNEFRFTQAIRWSLSESKEPSEEGSSSGAEES